MQMDQRWACEHVYIRDKLHGAESYSIHFLINEWQTAHAVRLIINIDLKEGENSRPTACLVGIGTLFVHLHTKAAVS
jgi:hypothetical protein